MAEPDRSDRPGVEVIVVLKKGTIAVRYALIRWMTSCADREFNSEKYPGYIYIGFRVVLSETGKKKLVP